MQLMPPTKVTDIVLEAYRANKIKLTPPNNNTQWKSLPTNGMPGCLLLYMLNNGRFFWAPCCASMGVLYILSVFSSIISETHNPQNDCLPASTLIKAVCLCSPPIRALMTFAGVWDTLLLSKMKVLTFLAPIDEILKVGGTVFYWRKVKVTIDEHFI